MTNSNHEVSFTGIVTIAQSPAVASAVSAPTVVNTGGLAPVGDQPPAELMDTGDAPETAPVTEPETGVPAAETPAAMEATGECQALNTLFLRCIQTR